MILVNIADRIKRSVSQSQAKVFIRKDFENFGSSAQVTRAVQKLVQQQKLVRIGQGVYARAKPSVLSGKPIPERPLEELAPEALKKLGYVVRPSKAVRDYNAGLTTQIPAGVVLNTGSNRVTRKLEFGAQKIRYENNYRRAV